MRVQENLSAHINTTALSLGIIVILASIFLVANTIRLTIYARRLLIRTMKLVGATDPFIQRPFIVEGVLQGLLAGLIASGIVWGLFTMLSKFSSPNCFLDLYNGCAFSRDNSRWRGTWLDRISFSG